MTEGNAMVKASLFRSHYDAALQMPEEERLAFYDAIFSYQFTGEMGDNLSDAVKWLLTAIRPVLDKDAESRQGRPECEPTAEEISAKKEELGSAKAAAEHFGISERTVYNKLRTARDCSKLQTAKTAKTAKTKEERRMQKEECRMENDEWRNENEEERDDAQCASAEPQAAPAPAQSSSSSVETSVEFPSERAARTPPPTREEVHALCKERGYSFHPDTFFAYYAATGWRRKGGARVSDWVAEAELWQAREKKDEAKARASPQYKTWRAEEQPAISEEERAAVAEGLGKIFGKLAQKCAQA